ncbi:M81 family metallopeptidase [Halomicrobium urmianum]|uniref:M81 family metallopeptidase n=1 Tax=Halomicrobium urmianum TaxID=1586233 RepID=UPI001CD9AEB3|nr:M81 family metallopeptidase [Halomicrobium urmianum]
MRVATATVSHETNTFSNTATTLDDFEIATGEELLSSFDGARSLAGIVETLRTEGVEVVPTVGAATIPSGTITADAFDRIQTELIGRLDSDVDGVCLDLHGSMYVDGEPDPEGQLLASVREIVGPDVPVVAALDMHATITRRMVDALDGVAGYRTAPHTDVVETGERAADLLLAALDGDATLVLGWERLPMLLAGERSETEAEPMTTLIDRLRTTDERDGIYDANYFLGFPWADSPHGGCHALVTGDADAGDAVDEVTTNLAAAFWERREAFDFTTEAHRPEQALDAAAGESDRPVVIAETGDIPGAGGSEDLTDFLSLVLARDDLGTPVLAVVADADSTDACVRAGEGEPVDLSLGRRYDDGAPLEASGTVRALHERDGTHTARVELDGGEVIVADERTNLHRDPSFFDALGIDPHDREVIALKSGYLSPAWKEVAARRLFALTAGDTNQLLEDLPYERVPRPIYPVDQDTEWSA